MIGVGEGGRPFLDYLLGNADEAGYRDTVIVVGQRDESIRDHYGQRERDNPYLRLTISYAVQPVPEGRSKPLGTADALYHGLRSQPAWRGRKFTVCNSDNLYSVEALRQMREAPEPSAMIRYDRRALEFEPERVERFAVIEHDRQMYLRAIIEKPAAEEVERMKGADGSVGVSMNIFRFSYDRILPYLEAVPVHPVRQEKELPSAIMMMLADHPHSMRVYPRAEHVPDLTDRNDILRVQEYLRATRPPAVRHG
jgi:glucose-1-phosphate adenylyltransferase